MQLASGGILFALRGSVSRWLGAQRQVSASDK
jgi:hypothetical protein